MSEEPGKVASKRGMMQRNFDVPRYVGQVYGLRSATRTWSDVVRVEH